MRIKIRNAFLPTIKHLSSREFNCIFSAYATPILQTSEFLKTKRYIQHGATTCCCHSISVAYNSLMLADWLGITCDKESLVKGALLHDYFLYDWHRKDSPRRLHGFTHPRAALNNALRDFDLNPVERNIIVRHMFPLTPIPPRYRESLIVCIADKLCSLAETLRINISPLADYPDVDLLLPRKASV